MDVELIRTKKAVTLLTEEKRAWLEHVALDSGQHDGPNGLACVMEAVSFVANEPWSDHPDCVSPVIAAFCRSWNDGLPDDDRTRLLRPLIPQLIGTRTDDVTESELAWMATDWLVRVQAPAWLRLASLESQAVLLEALGELTPERCPSIMPTLQAVRRAARDAARAAARAAAWDAARDAARAAARDAARAAAWAAARAAAWDAARDAARAAAWDAARDAARAAARAAARDALKPTVDQLQSSALDLLKRMISCAKRASAA